MHRTVLVLALLLLPAGSVLAADDVLQLRSGRLVVGKITAVDEKGVTIRTDTGEARYDWATLQPLCQYEIRAARVDPADARGHLALARFCLEQGLYPHAREELAVARGVGGVDSRILDDLSSLVDRAEADEVFARIERLTGEEEYLKAVQVIREFIKGTPENAYTKKARAMVADLLRRHDARVRRDAEERKQAEEDARNRRLAARLAKLHAAVKKAREAAAASLAKALRYHELGNVTRARKGYEAAEQGLIEAHRVLRKVQRLVPRGVVFEKAEKEKDAIEKKLVEVDLGLARLYVENRNYRRGIFYVNRVLALDPVNREALDLRSEIRRNWLHRRASDFTNTRPGRGK